MACLPVGIQKTPLSLAAKESSPKQSASVSASLGNEGLSEEDVSSMVAGTKKVKEEGHEKPLYAVAGTPFLIQHDGSDLGDLTAEIITKAWALKVDRKLIGKITGRCIDGIRYIFVPVNHFDNSCNNLIGWLFGEGSTKRFSLHVEGLTRDEKCENKLIVNFNKLEKFKFKPIGLGGYVFGMEDPFWSSLCGNGRDYFTLHEEGKILKGQVGATSFWEVDKALVDRVVLHLITALECSIEEQAIWEAFEKYPLSHDVFVQNFKACKFPQDMPAHKRAKIFLKSLERRYDPVDYTSLLIELLKTLCIVNVDKLNISDNEKLFLKKLVFGNPNKKIAEQLFKDYHHPRRDVIMAGHILKAPVPPHIIRVIEVGNSHVNGYAPKGSKEVRTLWDVLSEAIQKMNAV